MKINHFNTSGLLHIELSPYHDLRGYFVERFNEQHFLELNLPTNWRQDNFSRSNPGVLRGLHYQYDLPQAKLVTCVSGQIWDVAVDLRKNSPTFGQYFAVELTGDAPSWLYISAGFAHGFCVLGDQPADVIYKVDALYNLKGESGILWSDPDLNIPWPIQAPTLSPKDKSLPSFKQYMQCEHCFSGLE